MAKQLGSQQKGFINKVKDGKSEHPPSRKSAKGKRARQGSQVRESVWIHVLCQSLGVGVLTKAANKTGRYPLK